MIKLKFFIGINITRYGFLLLIVWICFSPLAEAQDRKKQGINFEKLFDDIFPVQDLDLNYEELYENLAQILANPMDLNKATKEELQSLFILSEIQINDLLDHREKSGQFISLYELQSISSIDLETLEKLIPFVTVGYDRKTMNQSVWKRMLDEKNNYFILRYERILETKRGYQMDTDSSSRYAGSADKYYFRYRVNHTGDFSFGVTVEKDAGEMLDWNPSSKIYGFDNYSVHAQIMNKGIVKNLIVGDFQAQFGQGLMLGGGFGMGKGSESITTIRRANLGFIPYTSLNEFGFFRGLAITVEPIKNLQIHGFGSMVFRDGLSQLNTNTDDSFFTSLTTSGLHRTPRELMARKQIQEYNYGVTLNYRKKSLDAGVQIHETIFSDPLQPTPTPYNQFQFSGDRNLNLGAYVNYSMNNYVLFGEIGHSLNNGVGFNSGVLTSLSPNFDLSLFIRHYDSDFYTFYTNAIAENSIPQNETGIYWGAKYKINSMFTASGYLDLFKFPWLKYRGYAPSTGSEWLTRLTYQPNKSISIFIQARQETKIRNLPDPGNLLQTGLATKSNFWINFDYTVSRNFNLKSRAQFSNFNLEQNVTQGLALIQDLNFDVGRFSFSTRYAIFDTDDFDNRQYTYERDVWLAFSFPSYSGVGVRSYLMVQYRLMQNMDIWIRWARIQYNDRDEIGSGSETIDGNTRNEIKFQLRFRLNARD